VLSILYYSNVVQRLTDFDLLYTAEYSTAGICVLACSFPTRVKMLHRGEFISGTLFNFYSSCALGILRLLEKRVAA
jgi:hypothetical protein